MSNTQHFGRMIRERREHQKMSLKTLADMCGMSEQNIEKIELGQRNPRLTSVLKTAAALDMDLGILNSCMAVYA